MSFSKVHKTNKLFQSSIGMNFLEQLFKPVTAMESGHYKATIVGRLTNNI
jgi:hypothetical protein